MKFHITPSVYHERVIKYLGSKRTLVRVLGDIAEAAGARTAVDLFTGTTRVAQEFKKRGMEVTASDIATYSGVLADCYIATDARTVDEAVLEDALAALGRLPGAPGYFTETFCHQARYFHPTNGARIDAVRDAIEDRYAGTALYPILLTSLMEAADRVDSTTGVQMAYLKQWAPRALKPLELRRPELLAGPGHSIVGDVFATLDELAGLAGGAGLAGVAGLARVAGLDELAGLAGLGGLDETGGLEKSAGLPPADLVYLDPPYNQHRYFTNYHIWETLVRWDAPEHYGIACKRVDARDAETKSVFNKKREMPEALGRVLERVKADLTPDLAVVSYNNEAWITADEMTALLRDAGFEDVRMLAFDYKRYVGAQIGIHNQQGQKVGQVSHTRNLEYVFVAGERQRVEAAVAGVSGGLAL